MGIFLAGTGKQARDSWEFMNVILGVAGGIAAYKSPEIVRRLKDAGHDVRVVMTAGGGGVRHPAHLSGRVG